MNALHIRVNRKSFQHLKYRYKLSPSISTTASCSTNFRPENPSTCPLCLLNAALGSSDHSLNSTSTHLCVVKDFYIPGYSVLEICQVSRGCSVHFFVTGIPRERSPEVSSLIAPVTIPAVGLVQQHDSGLIIEVCH